MIRWLVYAVLAIVGLVAVAALVGALLPRGHHASRRATYSAPPAAVFAAIADVARYPEWRGEVRSVELLPDDGQGRRFRETGPHGGVTYRVLESVPPRRFVVRIDDRLPFGGTWTYDLGTENGLTSLTITEDGEVYNPIFRLVSKFMSQTATIERYQAALAQRVGTGEFSTATGRSGTEDGR